MRLKKKHNRGFKNSIKLLGILKEAGLLVAKKYYSYAKEQYEIASLMATYKEDIIFIKKMTRHCDNQMNGISDLRDIGGSIFHNGVNIEELYQESLKMPPALGRKGSNIPIKAISKRRRGGQTIKQAMDVYLKSVGWENAVLEDAATIANEVKPGSKFNKTHLAYYISKYKKENQ